MKVADKITENQKSDRAEQTEQETGLSCFYNSFPDESVIVFRLGFGDDRKQKDGDGIGQDGWKHDNGKCHSGQDAIDTQCVRGTVSKQF